MHSHRIGQVKQLLRQIPDFPKPGILFYDISTLLQDATGFASALDLLAELLAGKNFDSFAAIESRGFIFGAALAARLQKGLILVRKQGKLPGKTQRYEYTLEYGSSVLEVTDVAISRPGQRVVIVDDLLATGGTAKAAAKLLSDLGAKVQEALFLIELNGLGGREALTGLNVSAALRL